MKVSRVLAVLVFGGLYALGNIGGNYVGWDVIFKWWETANGAATMNPVWTHPLVLFALAIGASGGQWWREWFDVQDRWKFIIYALMAADLGINAVGFYFLAMGSFPEPFVPPIFIFLTALAFVPNVLCQSLATLNLKALLNERLVARPARPVQKARLPVANEEMSLQRRTNGSVPLQIEEL